MATSTSTSIVPRTGTQDAKNIAADAPTIDSDAAAVLPLVPIMKAVLMMYQILSDRIGGQVSQVKNSMQQKKDDIDSCTELLNGLSSWNTPPLNPKSPPDPLDPANQDRIDKTNALYLNGISIPDSDYDAVNYSYGKPPKPAYTSLPILEIFAKDLSVANLEVGQLYRVVNVVPQPSGPDKLIKEDRVYEGPFNFGGPPSSPLDLKKQSGTDFSNATPGDLVQDLDTGKYYRISNAKAGVEVTGYPLQKFVQSPNSNVIASLNAQISQRINAASDLSKADSLELQKQQGFFTSVATICTELMSSINTASNNIIGKT